MAAIIISGISKHQAHNGASKAAASKTSKMKWRNRRENEEIEINEEKRK
jgi:hypothetical protein